MMSVDPQLDSAQLIQQKVNETTLLQNALEEAGMMWKTVRMMAGEEPLGIVCADHSDESKAALNALMLVIR